MSLGQPALSLTTSTGDIDPWPCAVMPRLLALANVAIAKWVACFHHGSVLDNQKPLGLAWAARMLLRAVICRLEASGRIVEKLLRRSVCTTSSDSWRRKCGQSHRAKTMASASSVSRRLRRTFLEFLDYEPTCKVLAGFP